MFVINRRLQHLAFCSLIVAGGLAGSPQGRAQPGDDATDRSAMSKVPSVPDVHQDRVSTSDDKVMRFPSDLPLIRDSGPNSQGKWTGKQVLVLIGIVLISAATLLFRRRRSTVTGKAAAGACPAWLARLRLDSVDGGVQVTQSRRLTGRASVHVLQWDSKEWLVGCTDGGMTLIGQRAIPANNDATALQASLPPGAQK